MVAPAVLAARGIPTIDVPKTQYELATRCYCIICMLIRRDDIRVARTDYYLDLLRDTNQNPADSPYEP